MEVFHQAGAAVLLSAAPADVCRGESGAAGHRIAAAGGCPADQPCTDPSELFSGEDLPVFESVVDQIISAAALRADRIGFSVEITGIKTTGIVRCDQPRVLDLKQRYGKKVDTLPENLLDEVLAKVQTLFEFE